MKKTLAFIFLFVSTVAFGDLLDGPPKSNSSSSTLSNIACSLAATACASVFGYYNVLWFKADPTASANSQTAFNNAITAACRGTTLGKVFIPAGKYLVNGGIDMSNLQGGCNVQGSYDNGSILQVNATTYAVIDMIGSANVMLSDFKIATSGTVATYGLLMASSSAQGCNVMNFERMSILGSWIQSAFYNYGCTDSKMELVQIQNYNPSCPYVVYLGDANIAGATSSFGRVSPTTGSEPFGDWSFISSEIHDISGSGYSTVLPLLINGGASPIRFIGGVIAGSTIQSTGAMVNFSGGSSDPVTAVSFIGQQYYADNGRQADYLFATQGSTSVRGLIIAGANGAASVGVVQSVSNSTYSGVEITGNTYWGAPIFYPRSGNNGTLTSAIVDSQGQAINLGSGGVISHSIILGGGTITASSIPSNVGQY